MMTTLNTCSIVFAALTLTSLAHADARFDASAHPDTHSTHEEGASQGHKWGHKKPREQRSEDGWSLPCNHGLETPSNAITPDSLRAGLVYTSQASGFYVSRDFGDHWLRTSDMPFDTLLADVNHSGTVYATLSVTGPSSDPSPVRASLYKVERAGETVSRVEGFGNPGVSIIAPLGVAPGNSDVLFVYLWLQRAGVPFLERTTDGGATWTTSPLKPTGCCRELAILSERHAYGASGSIGGPGSALYETLDGGDTWRELAVDLSPVGDVAVDRRHPHVLYASSIGGRTEPVRAGLRKSLDGGRTWHAPSDAFANRPVQSVEVSPVDSRVYLTVPVPGTAPDSSTHEVYVSHNGGTHFTLANEGLDGKSLTDLVADPRKSCTAYVVAQDRTAPGSLSSPVAYRTFTAGGTCR